MTLKVYSMFAGIGGIDLGLERTGGFKTVAFSEVDPYANRVLAHHWPDIPNLGDCTSAAYQDLSVDVIAAGFPCQDISIAGRQKGINDGERSGLWFEVVRAARELRPRYLLLENVSAIVSSNGGSDLAQVLGDLAEMGYDAEWACLRASDVGAPHLRARWFCIAWNTEWDSMAYAGRRRRSDNRLRSGRNESRGGGAAVKNMADAHIEGSQGHRETRERAGQRPAWTGRVFSSPRRASAWDEGIKGPGGRLVEPSIQLLAYGVPERVARLRAIGNAVVPQVAEHVGNCLLDLHDHLQNR